MDRIARPPDSSLAIQEAFEPFADLRASHVEVGHGQAVRSMQAQRTHVLLMGERSP